MSHDKNSGLTLLEVCFVLMIIAVAFGVAIPFSQKIFLNHPLENQLDSFDEMVLTALAESQQENRTARIVFKKKSILLSQSHSQADDALETEPEPLKILIPGGSKYQIQLWPDFEWISPEESYWDIPATGLILPLNIKWTLGDSWLAASIDPMTGEIKDVTYELN